MQYYLMFWKRIVQYDLRVIVNPLALMRFELFLTFYTQEFCVRAFALDTSPAVFREFARDLGSEAELAHTKLLVRRFGLGLF